jgi:hypothetical protein
MLPTHLSTHVSEVTHPLPFLIAKLSILVLGNLSTHVSEVTHSFNSLYSLPSFRASSPVCSLESTELLYLLSSFSLGMVAFLEVPAFCVC